MDKKDKKINELKKKLQSENTAKAIEILKQIRKEGQPGLIPMLVDLLHQNRNEAINLNICNILNDIKDTQSVPYFIESLKNTKYKTLRRELISACWQSGLNFSSHIPLFVEFVADENYETAIEAFTVVEENKPDMDESIIPEQIQFLKNKIADADTAKKALIMELIHVLES